MTREERFTLSLLCYPGAPAASPFARLAPEYDLWGGGLPPALNELLRSKWGAASRRARLIDEECQEYGIGRILPGDTCYPQSLLELSEPPLALYYTGIASALSREGVAIVGTRSATSQGLAMAEHIASLAVRAGHMVISGGAQGIDSAAHGAALAHEGAPGMGSVPHEGRTIAVLGGGLVSVLGSARTDLLRRVRAGGLLLGEYPPCMPARSYHFLRRNRILAALARHVFVVQAPKKSGALNTAGWARRLGRGVSVCLWPPDLQEGAGCAYIRGEGVTYTADGSGFLGQDVCYHTLAELYARLGMEDAADGDTRTVLRVLLGGGLSLSELVRASALAPEKALAALTRLELRGRVRSSAGRLYPVLKTA